MSVHNSVAQNVEKYVDQLYFGMLSYKPDSTIKNFITRFVPVVFKEFKSGGNWTAYAPDTFTEPPFETITNSFIFHTHPAFNAPFTAGQLAITQKIYTNPNWIDNITAMKLWYEFDNVTDAKNAFQKLIDTFSSFNVVKRVTKQKGIDRAEFTDKNSEKFYGHVQIILVTDYSLGKKLFMPSEKGGKIITEAGYKILIQAENNLY